jgi:hypothetical protein
VAMCFAVTLALTSGPEGAECPNPASPNWRPSQRELNAVLKAYRELFDSGAGEVCPPQFERSNLQGAYLSGAKLYRANLSGAVLAEANLTGALLAEANLKGADLVNADISGAILHHADLSSALFEPSSLADLRGIESVAGLSTLRFNFAPTALVLLRDDLRKRGLHAQAREVTYAIRSQERKHAWNKGAAFDAAFNYAAFEITCGYGFHQGRPLRILLILIPLFAIVYMVALIVPARRGGIWRVWLPERVLKDDGQAEPVRLAASLGWGAPQRSSPYRLLRVVALGLYMSILSAFHIGWRDLNVGTWIARLQPREYTLRATGWVRFVSGLQSLISVYLIALWVLTYFGKPFD